MKAIKLIFACLLVTACANQVYKGDDFKLNYVERLDHYHFDQKIQQGTPCNDCEAETVRLTKLDTAMKAGSTCPNNYYISKREVLGAYKNEIYADQYFVSYYVKCEPADN